MVALSCYAMSCNYDDGVNFGIYTVNLFHNSQRAVGYLGAFPWHGLDRPTGTDYFHRIRA